MRQNVSETLEVFRLELLRRASIYGDLEAWIVFQQSLEETVLIWFHDHPGSETACRLYNERHFVALAFERLRQAIVQGQVACRNRSQGIGVPALESERSDPGDAARLQTARSSFDHLANEESRTLEESFGIGYKRDFPIKRSSDWSICFITVG